jgi:hypothetical protein
MELVLIICHVAFFMACPINIIVAYQSKNKHAFCGLTYYERITMQYLKKWIKSLMRCPACGYYAFNGIVCYDCGYRSPGN